jgi:zinc transport system substrate-binding protein
MKRFLFIVMALSFSVCALFGGGKREKAANNGKLEVVAVNFPAYDFARRIAGDRINLTMMLPPGAESHSFEPTPSDIIRIQNCDVFIYTGGESDAWVDRILGTMDTSGTKVIRMMDAVDVVEEEIVEGMQDEHEHGDLSEEEVAAETPGHEHEEEVEYDEHVWTSPKNAKRIMQVIEGALCEADPVDAAAFRRNAAEYGAELDELDKEFQAVVNGAKRKTIVFGDRFPFRYFVDAYGLTYFAAFPGCSTETEPSAATVAFLIDKVKAEKIPVIFHIELSNERMADAIAAETGAKKLLLHACHNISKREFDRGVTFLELQRGNVSRLKEALQ